MFPPSLSSSSTRQFHSQIILSPCLHPPHLQASNLKLSNNRFPINPTTVSVRWVSTTVHSLHVSPWDDKPHQLLPGGQISYYDEMDVVSFLDPPKQLIPLDPSSYNPAAYLWKKIDDIPEERRHRLLALLNPRLISRAWEVAGTRYDNPKLAKQNSSILFAGEAGAKLLEYWHCQTNGGPLAVPWINYFKKALFRCEDGQTFGRVIVREVNEVMATEQPCDVAYEFGSGLLDIQEYPQGFPNPGKHPWPLNDQVVIYVRNIGAGVVVGQAWQEGEDLKQVPKKLCGEILMVKDYSHLDKSW
ncbi:uncharacterized protein LOC112516732 isoform X2 [Cynara cardunculus var. scolymus]|uniref:uncharacterized protein LOC112516732 isoform X2 n=1 Tax=Cynara cardunculus var. scolymus TaxID=59895 RepID=UPI000D628099|nr:uncharacterized protein LOC112516732 isoform X2 [Cynara cardunculus var. scolymus]